MLNFGRKKAGLCQLSCSGCARPPCARCEGGRSSFVNGLAGSELSASSNSGGGRVNGCGWRRRQPQPGSVVHHADALQRKLHVRPAGAAPARRAARAGPHHRLSASSRRRRLALQDHGAAGQRVSGAPHSRSKQGLPSRGAPGRGLLPVAGGGPVRGVHLARQGSAPRRRPARRGRQRATHLAAVLLQDALQLGLLALLLGLLPPLALQQRRLFVLQLPLDLQAARPARARRRQPSRP